MSFGTGEGRPRDDWFDDTAWSEPREASEVTQRRRGGFKDGVTWLALVAAGVLVLVAFWALVTWIALVVVR